MKKFNNDLMNFIDDTPTSYNCVTNISKLLVEKGYKRLEENDEWNLIDGGKYYTIRGDASIIAFNVGSRNEGFNIIASHSDSPSFKVKNNPEIKNNGFVRLNTSKYGGMINYSWLDKPLSIAGRVTYLKNGIYKTKAINVKKDIMFIPSEAIHINRDVNKGIELNLQTDMLPVIGLEYKYNLSDYIEAELVNDKIEFEKICDYDLYLYNRETGKLIGDEFIMSPRLDDLACVYTSLIGFVEGDNISSNVFCAFNNEEIGSLSQEGADSSFLIDTLTRISNSRGMDLLMTLRKSFIVSADNAHAIHPNAFNKSDLSNRVELNKGIVIKHHSNYSTNGLTSSLFKGVCERANTPYQDYECRSDMMCGSTLGNISLRHVSIDSIDVGLPQLSMHSANETIGIKDPLNAYKDFSEFYKTTFHKKNGLVKILKK